jgi:hypothetical protein
MAEMNQADQIREQILQLKSALETANPGMSSMLRTIHTNLRQDPAIVTLLTPEECGTIVAGLLKQTNTVIATAAVKSTKAKAAKISLDDL